MTDNTQPEALMQLADDYAEASFDQGLHKRTLDEAPENARSVLAAAVRSQHARISELEAQLSQSGFTAADMATASAQGFREGVASAQQPTTHVQNPAEIEHVAGDVSKNGVESNMTQQPAPSAAAAVGADEFECLHEWDGLVRTSMPPRYACKHCHSFFDAPLSPTPQADSQPAPKGETNVQLDIDSNHSTPEQQRDVAGSVALGQPVGNRTDQAASHLGTQGNKLLTVAERNIRSFLRSASFKSESDREAALNCVDVLWAAARTPADSVLEDAARWFSERDNVLHSFWVLLGEAETKADNDNDPLLRHQVEGFYRQWNALNGSALEPRWVTRAARKQGGAT